MLYCCQWDQFFDDASEVARSSLESSSEIGICFIYLRNRFSYVGGWCVVFVVDLYEKCACRARRLSWRRALRCEVSPALAFEQAIRVPMLFCYAGGGRGRVPPRARPSLGGVARNRSDRRRARRCSDAISVSDCRWRGWRHRWVAGNSRRRGGGDGVAGKPTKGRGVGEELTGLDCTSRITSPVASHVVLTFCA